MSLAVVRDLREARGPAGPDELAALETDVIAGLVLARSAAGLANATALRYAAIARTFLQTPAGHHDLATHEPKGPNPP